MDSSFLPYHARVQKPIALIDKAEHIALIFYSLGKNPPNSGEGKEIINLNWSHLQEVCKNTELLQQTTTCDFPLFLIYAMAEDIVYADIKHSSSEHSSSCQRSGKLDLDLLLKLKFCF